MKKFDAMMQWWSDDDAIIIPAGEDARIIDWLQQQDADTWHQVVLSWNYDHGDKVLPWILTQDKCDQGTAAQVFFVEGIGHWLWDALADTKKAQDPDHLCSLVLKNWSRYRTSELKPNAQNIPDSLAKMILEKGDQGHFAGTPLSDIMRYCGTRETVSKFASEDGKIVIDLEYWIKSKGIEITN